MKTEHRWEELRPEEFFAEMERAPLVYWSCGAMEEHGLHMALGTDWIPMYEVCLRAARVTGGIVFPQVPFAPAYFPGLSREELRKKGRELYSPSLWVSRELCEQLYTELMESMADMGFKACIALGGHAPAQALIESIHKSTGGKIRGMPFYGGGTLSLLKAELARLADPSLGGHGGMWESALVMAARPDWADLSRAERVTQAAFPSQLKQMSPGNLARVKDATVGFGEKLVQAATDEAVRAARELLAKTGSAP